MAELVDARDLKSLGPWLSGFESRCPHHIAFLLAIGCSMLAPLCDLAIDFAVQPEKMLSFGHD